MPIFRLNKTDPYFVAFHKEFVRSSKNNKAKLWAWYKGICFDFLLRLETLQCTVRRSLTSTFHRSKTQFPFRFGFFSDSDFRSKIKNSLFSSFRFRKVSKSFSVSQVKSGEDRSPCRRSEVLNSFSSSETEIFNLRKLTVRPSFGFFTSACSRTKSLNLTWTSLFMWSK